MPQRGGSSASKPDTKAAVEPQPVGEREGTRHHCSSSSEEPESATSTTSEEDDPLRGTAKTRQFCRRLVRSLYRGDWANLLFDKRSRRLFVVKRMKCVRGTDAYRAVGRELQTTAAERAQGRWPGLEF